MRKKRLLPVLLSLAVVVSGVGAAYASWSQEGRSTNIISTASVRGQILEQYEEGITVYPGSTVDKVVNVKNSGSVDMLARVSVEKLWSAETATASSTALSTDNISIDFDTVNWYYDASDGFYYYKAVLAPGESTKHPLFSSFHVSTDTDGAYAGHKGEIRVNLECVQAGGDGVQFWNKTLQQLGVTYQPTARTPVTVGVNFAGTEQGFVFDDDQSDLFAGFKNLVPGETCTQLIRVGSSYAEPLELFLRAQSADQGSTDSQTAQLIQQMLDQYAVIKVTDESGTVIYNGPAGGNLSSNAAAPAGMQQNASLGQFRQGTPRTLQVQLTLDPQMDNAYRELVGKVAWVFSASGAGVEVETPITPTTPSTGDNSNLVLWLSLMGASAALLCGYAVWQHKKGKK